jgi:hypothetical protein
MGYSRKVSESDSGPETSTKVSRFSRGCHHRNALPMLDGRKCKTDVIGIRKIARRLGTMNGLMGENSNRKTLAWFPGIMYPITML